MTDDIEECLQVVIKELRKAAMPPRKIATSCKTMHKADRVKFICDDQLHKLLKNSSAEK